MIPSHGRNREEVTDDLRQLIEMINDEAGYLPSFRREELLSMAVFYDLPDGWVRGEICAAFQFMFSVDAADLTRKNLEALKAVIARHPGASEVILHFHFGPKSRRLRLGDSMRVEPSHELAIEMREAIGA